MANANVLSAHSLASLIAQSLPAEASPQLKSPYDAVAVAVHAAMIAVGFRLIGLGEDDRLPHSDKPVRTLPDNWNLQSPASFSFKYAHTQSSMQFLVKVNRMGTKAVVMGMGIGDDKTTTFDVKIDEYISPSSVPASPTKDDTTPTPSETPSNPSSPVPTRSPTDLPETPKHIRQKVIDIFISNGRLSDFGALARLHLIQKLLPSLHKQGYEETRAATSAESTSTGNRPQRPDANEPSQPARPNPLHDPLAMPPRRPGVAPGEFAPPGFEDEYDMTRPPRPFAPGMGGGNMGIGHRDLYPQGLGPNDPFRNIGPGLGGPGGGMGGGMHPDFNDPMFTGQGRGRGGDDPFGYDSQAPPGARYDPVGPGGAPRGSGGGGRFPGGGAGGMGGRPHNPFGGFGGGDFI
ncbi:PI31 proteasome regulator N-terminal-domain-containing protein [Elsinoe ampelina]|uniref:PI31 proteasome regulator N-terminal-domain-containing protein n=1 Tax=Elsinoe ampelina TaxID=302913 RepID=A0A6A6GLS8_9PEZI|nr:PI31 proteasome regulator N-terminal-domain-containing protein [Elsinoe ampelina]